MGKAKVLGRLLQGTPGSVALITAIGLIAFMGLLVPFWPSEAHACYTMPPPKTHVNGFANANIAGVTYPETINKINYLNKRDFLHRYPQSPWNLNFVTIENGTVPPPGSTSGGPSNPGLNPGALTNTGAFASIPVPVK